jgi:hypothetical protein
MFIAPPPPVACGDDIDRIDRLGSWAQNDAQLAMGGIGGTPEFCGMDNIRDILNLGKDKPKKRTVLSPQSSAEHYPQHCKCFLNYVLSRWADETESTSAIRPHQSAICDLHRTLLKHI